MLRTVLVAAMASSLRGLNATPAVKSTSKVIDRVGYHSLNDACHPMLKIVTSNCNKEPIDPCVSEQFLTSSCEVLSQNDKKAYRDCLRGSTVRSDQEGCLACKKEAWEAFFKEDSEDKSLVQLVHNCMNGKGLQDPSPPKKTIGQDAVPLEKYWKDPVGPLVPVSDLDEKPVEKDDVKNLRTFDCNSCKNNSISTQDIDKAVAAAPEVASDKGDFLIKEVDALAGASTPGQVDLSIKETDREEGAALHEHRYIDLHF
ncbi:hypothetical protein ED733_009006 [Metarhizium rileyi]|uniref:Uncharacterized protein n=1 Tax=Metarhizium rileyi (strain RCEF 4871) TaxID=1649241 RepID=A0A5C6GQE3_METRR|nr:hypothetical protein ED733_009006 [Metarhizium rileyi]